MRPVKASERVGTLWIIESGLKVGEQVVVEDLQKSARRRHRAPKLAAVAATETAPAAKL